MMKTTCRLLTLAILLAVSMGVGCGGDDDGKGNQSPTTTSRPWLDESDFDRDPSLHATPEQVIVLHLDPAPPGADLIRHTIRYMVEETIDATFCIPEDEPHLRLLELVSEALKDSMVHLEQDDECVSVTIPPGTYELHVMHDGTNVPATGARAFLHHPAQFPTTGSAQLSDGGGAGPATLAVPNFMAFRYNNKFVTTSSGKLQPAATSVDAHAVFRFTGGPTQYEMKDGTGATVKTPSSTCSSSGTLSVSSGTAQMFEFEDNGNGNFGFCLVPSFCNGNAACISVDGYSNTLLYNNNGKTGTSFSTDYDGYDCATGCDSSVLPLDSGEVALFAEENFIGPAVVFRADVPKMSIYNGASGNKLSVGNDMVSSVRVGPNTRVVLYQNGSYGGDSVIVAADAATLDGTPVGDNAMSSFHIDVGDTKLFILESNGCEDCILTGIDLSFLTLTGGNFAGARLSRANLNGTVLREANLNGATISGSATNLSGTDFTLAKVHCTDFSETDMSNATFGSMISYVYALDEATPALLRTDPVTGDRVVVSGSGTGSGTQFVQPNSLALASDGSLYVTDASLGAVFHVVPASGARTVVSSSSVGSGPSLVGPSDIAIESSGQLVVANGLGTILRVNPSTGARTTVSGGSVGSGPALVQPAAVAVDAQGQLIVADRAAQALFSVNPSSGARIILSSAQVGLGPAFDAPVDVAIDAYGNLFVADLTLPGVFRVDPGTGARTLVSGSDAGTGTMLFNVASVADAGNGTLFVSDQILGVVQINAASGNRTVISGSTTGDGPVNESPAGVAMDGSLLTRDFSCRLNAQMATVNVDLTDETLPVDFWRFMDLSGVELLNVTSAPLSTVEEPVDLSGVLLNDTEGLTSAVLDGVKLDCATPSSSEPNCSQLVNTVLNQASMVGASAVNATMNGAKLIHANLEGANLSGAQFQKTSNTVASGILDGAQLKHANLSGANLSGASMVNANWYSGSSELCDGASWTGNCASGTDATLSNADLSDTYLAGLDLSGATLQGTNFRAAILAGAHLNMANISGDPNTGAFTQFNGAFLEGANFDSLISSSGANFTGAYLDLMSTSGLEIIWQLPNDNLQFTGYVPPESPPECVFFSTSSQTTTPEFASGYTCPDGSNSPCADDVWQCDTCFPDSSSTPPTSVNGSLPGQCTKLDFNW